MEVPLSSEANEFLMDDERAKILRCQTHRLQKKIDSRAKKRQEKEEKRRKRILHRRKMEIDANNQRFLREPIISIQQRFHSHSTANKCLDKPIGILKLPNLTKQIEKEEDVPEVTEVLRDVKAIKKEEMKDRKEFPSLQSVTKREESYLVKTTKFWDSSSKTLEGQSDIFFKNDQLEGESWKIQKPTHKSTQTGHRDSNATYQDPDGRKPVHIPPIEATKMFRNNATAKDNRHHSMMQRLVLEEVKRVLDIDDKSEAKEMQRNRLPSDDSLGITINSITEEMDNFSLGSDYERPIDIDDGFSVGSAYDRYGDAVVVLSPVMTRTEDNGCEVMAENSISSSGMGGSFHEDVLPREHVASRRRSTKTHRKTRTSKESRDCFCSCKNCQLEELGLYKSVSKEDELLSCLKKLDARLQETEMQMRDLQVKTAMKLISEGLIEKRKIMNLCSMDIMSFASPKKIQMRSAPPPRRLGYFQD